ncbi:unnamed protein product [Phytomonas sp. Hart1]|nr:unnamed protein product [Phytomonas sp. Hart1]|eukprot:CCW68012.1 unnamed protein product [Phytomonas sp. isolate Hart1]
MRPFYLKRRPSFITDCYGVFFSLQFSLRGVASARPNFYKRLKVEGNATPEEIKAAYRRRALECHPDVVEDHQRTQAEVQFRGISEAYEVLSNPESRRAHDRDLGMEFHSTKTTKTTTGRAARGASVRDSPVPPSEEEFAASSSRKGRGSTWRKPFLRGDADRLFAEVFQGKTVDQIIFDLRRRQRSGDFPREAAGVLGAIEHAAARAERQFGPSILKHLRVCDSRPRGPAPPPAAEMSFRPFRNRPPPAGVRTPQTPRMGVVRASGDPSIELLAADEEARPPLGHFYAPKLPDGREMSRLQGIDQVERMIMGAAHNMGVLYSYQRPY